MKKQVSFSEFEKLDIRIGTVVKAEVPEWSHWVMKLTVDFSSKGRSASGQGDEVSTRVIFAGLKPFYFPKELEGKQFPFVVNLEPKKIGPTGDVSEGMMLMAIDKLKKPIVVEGEEIDEDPVLMTPAKKVLNGTRVY